MYLCPASEDSIEYHFDPMNSDAELTYLKLSTCVGTGENNRSKSQFRNKTSYFNRYKIYRFSCPRTYYNGRNDVVHVGNKLWDH